jgi:hypothetical protein
VTFSACEVVVKASGYAVDTSRLAFNMNSIGQCSMKGACQAKTSPTLAIKRFFFDRQPQLTHKPRNTTSTSDLLTHAYNERTHVCS